MVWTEDMKVMLLALVIITSCIFIPFTIIIWVIIGLLVWLSLRRKQRRCSRCKGKTEVFISVDFADRGAAAVAGEKCVKCGLIKVLDLSQVSTMQAQHDLWLKNVELSKQNIEEHLTKIARAACGDDEVKVKLKPVKVGTMNRGVLTGCRYCLQGSTGKVMEGYMLKHLGGYYTDWCEGCPYPVRNGVISPPYDAGLDKTTLERI